MENISNTSNKGTQYDISLYLAPDISCDDELVKLSQKVGFLPTTNIKGAHYYLDASGGHFHLKDKNDFFSYTCNKQVLPNVLRLLKSSHGMDQFSVDEELFKRINQRIKNHREKHSPQTRHLNDLNQKLYSAKSLEDFTKCLFKIKALKKFQTFHLFIHEKGQASANHFEISRERLRTYNHTATEFNSLFQSIKKSKNRSFGQSTLRGFNFDILGTFLAHEFSLTNHNIIIIASRNDFLTQNTEEVVFFNFLAKNLSSYFEILLEKNLISDKISTLESALHESPYEIQINSQLSGAGNTQTLNQHISKSGKTFKISPLFQDVINHADVFHHERVSVLGELLNTLRHELSNPIFGLQLTTELLLLEFENQDVDTLNILKEILLSTKRSQKIIENFSKLYKGTNESTKINVVGLIEEVYTLTKSESRHLHKKIDTETDDLELWTNSTWLAQIFFNLVINSAQALKSSTSHQAVFTIHISRDQDFIIFDIRDNGPGIPSEKIKDIFKAFYTTKDQGTGLGLSIAKNLSTKLNGHLLCIPDDKGAHFNLRLPYENSSYRG